MTMNRFRDIVNLYKIITSVSSTAYNTAQKMKFPADLVTFTEEILNIKLHFVCSVM